MPRRTPKPNEPPADRIFQQGIAALNAGRGPQAVTLFRQAIAAAPKEVSYRLALAQSLHEGGAAGEAIVEGLKALALDPNNDACARLLTGLLGKRRLTGYHLAPAEARAITAWLERPDGNGQAFASLAIDHLKAMPPLASILSASEAGGPIAGTALLLSRQGRQAVTDPMFLALLRGAINTDPKLEALLTAVRRQILTAEASLALRPGMIPFAAALARQCDANEFVFSETEAERNRVDALADALGRRDSVTRADEWPLLLTALYRPLDRLPSATAIVDAAERLGPDMRAVIARTVVRRRQEAQLAARIPTLLPETDPVSAKVRDHYEANPYPRWAMVRLPEPGSWRNGLARFGNAAEIAALGSPPDVLIAGCGTGQQAVTAAASYGPTAAILAIDLSRASLGYAAQMASDLGLSNVEFAQADLLRLPELGRTFTIIECAGVLHHLGDMAAGLEALTACLAPGGFLRLALYSRAARRDVNAARAEIADGGFAATPSNIRAFRQSVLTKDTPWAQRIRDTFRDFYNLSGCRDLLFHMQEHQLTIPEIRGLLDGVGLEFRGFVVPPDFRVTIAHHFESTEKWRDLGCWAEAENANPDLFLGMYNFWTRKPTLTFDRAPSK